MRCEPCQGTGKAKMPHYIVQLPCPHCMGTGLAYCCEGLVIERDVDGDKLHSPVKIHD